MNTSIVHLKDMISNHIVTNPNGLNHVLEWTINALMKVDQLDFLNDQLTGFLWFIQANIRIFFQIIDFLLRRQIHVK